MIIDIPFRYIVAAELIGFCWVLGAAVGVGVALRKIRGERRAA